MVTIRAGIMNVTLPPERAKMVRSILAESVERASLIETDLPDTSREIEVIPNEISGDADRLFFEFRFSDRRYRDSELSGDGGSRYTVMTDEGCVGDMTFVVDGGDVSQCQMNVRSRDRDSEVVHSAVLDLYRTVYSIITGHLDK